MCKMARISVRLNLKNFFFDILCCYGVAEERLPGGGIRSPTEIGLSKMTRSTGRGAWLHLLMRPRHVEGVVMLKVSKSQLYLIVD